MKTKATWFEQAADAVERRIERMRLGSKRIICASGISPSGEIHLGNLREAMTSHVVSEALRWRGVNVEHIHSWDDFDRLRKVPAGMPPEFAQHVGKPLSVVPDPFGEYDSWATRF